MDLFVEFIVFSVLVVAFIGIIIMSYALYVFIRLMRLPPEEREFYYERVNYLREQEKENHKSFISYKEQYEAKYGKPIED